LKKLIILTFIFAINNSTINAADPKGVFNSPLKDYSFTNKNPSNRIFVGGDIGATFGDYTQISINPLIGYRISNEVSTGLQFVYNHSWQYINKDQVNQTTLQSNTYGGNAFLQYNPIPSFYLKGEFEYDSYTNYETTQGTKVTNAVPFLFLGAGYSTPLSKNSTLNAGIKVDVLNNENSPYDDFTPFFYVGAGIGI